MRIGISSDGKEIEKKEICQTPADYYSGLEVFRDFLDKNALAGKIKAVAGGIAGPLDHEKTMLINSPNLPLWVLKPLKTSLFEMMGAPVFLENDSAVVGLGETVRGAGHGQSIVAYLGIGTGIGGVRIVNGKIDEYSVGFEPGHQVIDISSTYVDGCGGLGHLEALISGTGVERIYNQKPEEITDKKILEDIARILAYGVNNTIVYWSPDVVILGGSMMKIISIDLVKFYLEETFRIYSQIPPLKEAILGDSAGLLGSLALLVQHNQISGI